jgi:hypothetical protein
MKETSGRKTSSLTEISSDQQIFKDDVTGFPSSSDIFFIATTIGLSGAASALTTPPPLHPA